MKGYVMIKIWLVFSLGTFGSLALSKNFHASVKKTSEFKSDKNQLSIEFKIVPKPGMALSFDAPWSLKISESKVKWKNTELKKKDMDKNLPGFKIQASSDGSPGQLIYKLTAFICTADKTRCYREIYEDKVAWQGKSSSSDLKKKPS